MRGQFGAWLVCGALACSGDPQPSAPSPGPSAEIAVDSPRVAPLATTVATETVTAGTVHAVRVSGTSPAVSDPVLPRLAIVIDDLGFRRDRVQELLALGLTLTYAVLPAEPRTPDVVAALQAAGVPMIVHMPMEPKGYPATQPGPCAMLLAESQRWSSILRDCAGRITGARGLNNHMGSALTENAEAMTIVAQYLRETGGYFLDSVTSGHSVAEPAMRAAGVPVVRRDVFLDDTRDETQITVQLHKAISRARARGAALAIGHPYPETMRVLARAKADGSLDTLRLVAAQELAH